MPRPPASTRSLRSPRLQQQQQQQSGLSPQHPASPRSLRSSSLSLGHQSPRSHRLLRPLAHRPPIAGTSQSLHLGRCPADMGSGLVHGRCHQLLKVQAAPCTAGRCAAQVQCLLIRDAPDSAGRPAASQRMRTPSMQRPSTIGACRVRLMGLLKRGASGGASKVARDKPGDLAVQASPKSESAAQAAGGAALQMDSARSLSCPHEVCLPACLSSCAQVLAAVIRPQLPAPGLP